MTCDAGTQAIDGGDTCDACGLGKATGPVAGSACVACEAGKYADSLGSIECDKCSTLVHGDGYTSVGGASSCALCQKGYYMHPNGPTSAGGCRSCPPQGAVCEEGTTLATLVIEEGFYRASYDAETVYPCPMGSEVRSQIVGWGGVEWADTASYCCCCCCCCCP